MIQNINVGYSVTGALTYVVLKTGSQKLGCGTLAGRNIGEMKGEMASARRLRPKLKRALFHTSISLDQPEHFSDDQWEELVSEYMYRLGFESAPWCSYRHTDTDHDHVHIVALRIDMITGRAISDSHDFRRGAEIIQDFEKRFGLRMAAQLPGQALERAPSRAEIRTGRSDRLILRELVIDAIENSDTIADLIENLDFVGVSIAFHATREQCIVGLSFSLDQGPWMKASSIGQVATWKTILSRGISYEHERDFEAIRKSGGIRTIEAERPKRAHGKNAFSDGFPDQRVAEPGSAPPQGSKHNTETPTEFFGGIPSVPIKPSNSPTFDDMDDYGGVSP